MELHEPTSATATCPRAPPCPGRGYQRLDEAGQHAREVFVQAVVESGTDADANLAVQVARNPITAASILATGSSLGATTLVNVLLDEGKLARIRALSQRDPLTGASSLVEPEVKMAAALAVLLLSFFALAQSLRLLVHFAFFARAAAAVRHLPELVGGGQDVAAMARNAVTCCLRGQTYFSVGLRCMYGFIPVGVCA